MTETNKEVPLRATCPQCSVKEIAKLKGIIVNPFQKGLEYPEYYCPECRIYFTVREDI